MVCDAVFQYQWSKPSVAYSGLGVHSHWSKVKAKVKNFLWSLLLPLLTHWVPLTLWCHHRWTNKWRLHYTLLLTRFESAFHWRRGAGGFFTKGWIAYLLLIRNIWTIKLFTNREQIRILNSKSTDLDWYYSRLFGKLKRLIGDLLFATFVKYPPEYLTPANEVMFSQLSVCPREVVCLPTMP